ncbi:MAG: adenylyltransferase/cytidyltransferase family protein, partial [Bacteroidales bacterium]|nr:adenylyltransferase/cytidyltransferase family protein [Bacteroidales bacterium]
YKNFVVSYKGNIIYGTEYQDITDNEFDTIGESQYKAVTDHVQENYKGWKSLPTGTEFFFEFLMQKPTLTRQYTKLRELIYLGKSSVSSIKIQYGKINTSVGALDMTDREKYAKIFKVNLPELLFSGNLYQLPKGLNSRALPFYKNYKDLINGVVSDYDQYQQIVNFFLSIPSAYGAEKEEGTVIELSKPIGKSTILKMVQLDQYDKDLRNSIKMKFKMEPLSEDKFWREVRVAALEVIKNIPVKTSMSKALKMLSKNLYVEYNLTFGHKKKTERNIKDDIQHVAKTILIKRMPGNDGVLVVGKFRVFTNGHKKMFDQALKKHDFLIVTLVSNKETKATLELRKQMIEAVYPGVYIITTTSGNLFTMINKSKKNINTVLAGSDRIAGYEEQLQRTLDIKVEEIPRGEEDESATKVIRNLSDIKYFNKNVPKQIKKFYNDLKSVYTQGESFRTENMVREVIKIIKENK